MGNNVREGIMELDLNSVPLDPPHGSVLGLGSLLNELETAHGRIEERIRQLEAVTSRARQRQRWRTGQSNPQMVNISAEHNMSNVRGEGGTDSQERFENGKLGKRDSSHLIAKALAMDTDTKQVESDGGGFFDCNICLAMARDPILTCCGHLFCWLCFYQLSYAHPNVRECPACNGEVTDTSIVPIYGNGNDNNACKSKFRDSGLQFPPRPRAPRIESLRQQLINRGSFPSPIGARIQQFSNIIGAVGERTGSQDVDGEHVTREMAGQHSTTWVLPTREAESNQHHRSRQVSRLLLQGAASFSSLSSALNLAMDSAERLVEDLEAYINSNHTGRRHEESSHVDRDSFSSIAAVIQPESQSMEVAAEIESAVAPSAPSLRSDVPGNVINLENETTDSALEVSSRMLSSSSSRERRRRRRLR